jgi:hypothetical protein
MSIIERDRQRTLDRNLRYAERMKNRNARAMGRLWLTGRAVEEAELEPAVGEVMPAVEAGKSAVVASKPDIPKKKTRVYSAVQKRAKALAKKMKRQKKRDEALRRRAASNQDASAITIPSLS